MDRHVQVITMVLKYSLVLVLNLILHASTESNLTVIENHPLVLPFPPILDEKDISWCYWQYEPDTVTGWDQFIGYDCKKPERLNISSGHNGWGFMDKRCCQGKLWREHAAKRYTGRYEHHVVAFNGSQYKSGVITVSVMGVPVKCDRPPEDKNGNVSFGDLGPGAIAVHTCKNGFAFANQATQQKFFCMVDGEWNGKPEPCQESVHCGRPEEAKNAVFEVSNDTSPGSMLTYVCNDGYSHPDGAKEKTVQCLSNGTWDKTVEHCTSTKNTNGALVVLVILFILAITGCVVAGVYIWLAHRRATEMPAIPDSLLNKCTKYVKAPNENEPQPMTNLCEMLLDFLDRIAPENASLKTSFNNVKEELENFQEEKINMGKQIKTYAEENGKQKEKIKNMEKELNELKENMEKMQKEKQAFETDYKKTKDKIKVLEGLNFLRVFEDKIVEKKSDMTLAITFAEWPIREVIWERNQKTLKPSSTIEYNKDADQRICTLLVKAIDQKMAGVYTCKVLTNSGEYSHCAAVHVNKQKNKHCEVPQAVINDTKVKAVNGKEVILEAQFSGKPLPVSIWYFMDQPVKVSPNIANQQSYSATQLSSKLIIKAFKESEAGVYTCKAWNPYGNSECAINVDVSEKTDTRQPVFDTPSQVMNVKVGGSIQITTNVEGDPEPTITWQFKDTNLKTDHYEHIKTTKMGNRCTLSVNKIQYNLFGRYKCLASNKYGSATHTVTVNVLEPPVIIYGLKDTSGEEGFTAAFCVVFTSTVEASCEWLNKAEPLLHSAHTTIDDTVDGSTRTSTLVIHRCSQSYAGNITVNITSDGGICSSSAWLNVLSASQSCKPIKTNPVVEEEIVNDKDDMISPVEDGSGETDMGCKNIKSDLDVDQHNDGHDNDKNIDQDQNQDSHSPTPTGFNVSTTV